MKDQPKQTTMEAWNLIYIAQHAHEIFTKWRWPNGVICVDCARRDAITRLKDGRYKCRHCGRIFSDKTHTLFEGSKLPAEYWIIALYLTITDNGGCSSYELARKLHITQKAAYYMQMRLRQAFSQDDVYIDSELVAHDEVYIGGDYRNFSLKKRQQLIRLFDLPIAPKTVKEKIALGNAINHRTKKAVFGITDGKQVVLKQIPTPIKQEYLIDIYTKHVSPNGLAVGDNSKLYDDWTLFTGRELHTNNHSKGQFIADNGTSSNMIENIFSWLERSNIFVHVHYSRRYTQLYLDEFAFRYNIRDLTVKERMEIAIKKCCRRYDRGLLMKLNAEENKLYRTKEFFHPKEFFEKHGSLINEYSEGGLIYRRKDYLGYQRLQIIRYIIFNQFQVGLQIKQFGLLIIIHI